MAAQFHRAFDIQGFDSDPTPRWQMVPLNGDRYVILRGGAGLTVTSLSPGIVTVSEIPLAQLPTENRRPQQPGDRFFKLHGVSKGNARIRASQGATSVVELEVDTKNKKTVSVTFNFVSDNAGHKTRRNTSQTRNWLWMINLIYKNQANIEVTQRQSRNVTVPANLGSVIRFTTHLPGVAAAEHEWDDVIALRDAAADVNIFLVWEYEQDNTPLTDHTDAAQLDGNVLYEDDAGRQTGETMAHEIGHYLGVADQYDAARKRELMYGYTDVRGIHLPKAHVNTMNP